MCFSLCRHPSAGVSFFVICKSLWCSLKSKIVKNEDLSNFQFVNSDLRPFSFGWSQYQNTFRLSWSVILISFYMICNWGGHHRDFCFSGFPLLCICKGATTVKLFWGLLCLRTYTNLSRCKGATIVNFTYIFIDFNTSFVDVHRFALIFIILNMCSWFFIDVHWFS